jgi:hypothetical protein
MFAECYLLDELIFSDAVCDIDDGFIMNTCIKKITLPLHLQSISPKAFHGAYPGIVVYYNELLKSIVEPLKYDSETVEYVLQPYKLLLFTSSETV